MRNDCEKEAGELLGVQGVEARVCVVSAWVYMWCRNGERERKRRGINEFIRVCMEVSCLCSSGCVLSCSKVRSRGMQGRWCACCRLVW